MSAATQRKQLPRTTFGIGGSDALLGALQSAHRQIDAAFAELERVSSGLQPETRRLNAARLRIGQANLARRRIVNQVCSYLSSVISVHEREMVRELQRQDEDCSQKVSELVRHWTPEAIANDWDGYRVASRTIRAGIVSVVTAEKELLYRLLARN